MNYTEHYHDWLRDAHAMEKQAESMLESMASRIENYPDIKPELNNILVKPNIKLPCSKKYWTVMAFLVRC